MKTIYAGVPFACANLPHVLKPCEYRDLNLVMGYAMKLSRLRLRGEDGLFLVGASIDTTRLGHADSAGNVRVLIPITQDGLVWRFPAVLALQQCRVTCTFENRSYKNCQLDEAVWWGLPVTRHD